VKNLSECLQNENLQPANLFSKAQISPASEYHNDIDKVELILSHFCSAFSAFTFQSAQSNTSGSEGMRTRLRNCVCVRYNI